MVAPLGCRRGIRGRRTETRWDRCICDVEFGDGEGGALPLIPVRVEETAEEQDLHGTYLIWPFHFSSTVPEKLRWNFYQLKLAPRESRM